MTDRLDDLIEQELATSFARVDARPPLRPRYLESRAASRRWRPAGVLAGVPAALGTKMVVALAAATIAGTGVAAKAALTGNPDPLTWGGQAQPHTQTCGGGPCAGAVPPAAASAQAVPPTPDVTPSPGADEARAVGGGLLPGRDSDTPTPRAHGTDGEVTPGGSPASPRAKGDGGSSAAPEASPGTDHQGSSATPGHGSSGGSPGGGDSSGH
jgi:hypothetical protein